ncbi:Uncharacterized protein QTN25_009615 [Entamoeba marina]
MGDYTNIDFEEVVEFSRSTGSTSLGIPVIVESILASLSALSGLVILYTEKQIAFLIYMSQLIGYILIKGFFITMSVLRTKNETFVGIPGLATMIFTTANRI